MSQALYRKWRPHLWAEVVGQEHIVQTIQNAIRSERVGHAYLFAGPRGTGKTTTARLLAKAVNCLDADLTKRPCDACAHCLAVNSNSFLDLIEIDAASNTSVEDVRDLRDKINFSPSQGRFKVYIIDEVHMLSTAAFNALLKTLEEPPSHAIFILATTEVHKIPATVLSRCQRHEFRRIPVMVISTQLRLICTQERLVVDDEALTLIARQSTGSMRDAISLLDQLTSTGEAITLQAAQTVLGTATNQTIVDLVQAAIERQAGQGLNHIHQALDNGTDPRQFARQAVEYLRSLLLIKMGSTDQVDVPDDFRALMAKQTNQLDTLRLLEFIRLFNAAAEGRSGWHPSLMLELALAEAVQEARPVVMAAAPAQLAPAAVPSAPAEMRQPQELPPLPAATPMMPATSSAPSAPEKLPPSNSAAPNISLEQILQGWKRVRETVKKYSGQTDGLLNSCKLVAYKDGLLTLGFASDVVKSKMEDDKHLDLTRRAIYQVLKVSLQLNCVVSGRSSPTTPAQEADSGGMVHEALNLGGKIVSSD